MLAPRWITGVLVGVAALQGCADPPTEPAPVDSSVNLAKKPGPGSGYQALALETLPGGIAGVAQAINASGEIVGWSSAADGSTHAVVWAERPAPQQLGTAGVPGATWSQAVAVNAAGQVGGNTSQGPAIWERSGSAWSARLLEAPGALTGMNDAGEAVGYHNFQPLFWDASGAIQQLPLPASYTQGGASGIGNGLFVAGYVEDVDGDSRAVVWLGDGSSWATVFLSGLPGGRNHQAIAVSNPVSEAGVQVLRVAGIGGDAKGLHALRWTLTYDAAAGEWRETRRDDLGTQYAYGINDRGDVVGFSRAKASSPATLWPLSGGAVKLPGLQTSNQSGVGLDVNDAGRVVGKLLWHGEPRPVVWVPGS